jgi:hypothetical protein
MIGVALPRYLTCPSENNTMCLYELQINRTSVWRFYYGLTTICFTAYTNDTEAEARARFWLYLKEEGLI